jgi:SOS response regulatory protein OraA/RecX
LLRTAIERGFLLQKGGRKMLEMTINKHFEENIKAISILQEEGFSEKEIQELINRQEEQDKEDE